MIERAMNPIYTEIEHARERAFQSIWSNQIDAVFSDVAEYYDRANVYATLGLIDRLRRRFLSTMNLQLGAKVLDVCAGTNVIGIDLLKKQPDLEVCAVDRSKAMQGMPQLFRRRHPHVLLGGGALQCSLRAGILGRRRPAGAGRSGRFSCGTQGGSQGRNRVAGASGLAAPGAG